MFKKALIPLLWLLLAVGLLAAWVLWSSTREDHHGHDHDHAGHMH